MAIAKQSAGVTFGYKPKAKRVERRNSTWLQRIVGMCIVNAREMREFVADEIAYETMDTIRLLNYLRYEFGLAGPRRMVNDERRTMAENQVVGWSDGQVVTDGV